MNIEGRAIDVPKQQETRCIFTPHPITLDGQRNIAAELIPGETLRDFLARSVPEDMGDAWEVRINGVLVPHEVMGRVRPKPGTVIEVRSVVGKQALAIVAYVALMWWTFTAVAALGTAGGSVFGLSGAMGYAAVGAVQFAGSALGGKVVR